MSSHWNSRRGSIASPLIRMAASFSSGKGLPFFISVLLSLSLSPYLFLAPSLSLRQGNSSLGINPLQIRLKHWVIIWPTGCSDQSSKACVCVCVSVCIHVCLSICDMWKGFKASDFGRTWFLYPETKWAILFHSSLCLFAIQLGG